MVLKIILTFIIHTYYVGRYILQFVHKNEYNLAVKTDNDFMSTY